MNHADELVLLTPRSGATSGDEPSKALGARSNSEGGKGSGRGVASGFTTHDKTGETAGVGHWS